ncbi:dispanin subfamily A member 2b [Bombina bombina]|uniref:dispanin subfamily A member 2b n=1 Tax=Bombina bombina TaxID=8345 RepID=UPI00235A73E7|nr:dispanin subfamily A member 2b [Bombina bombina]
MENSNFSKQLNPSLSWADEPPQYSSHGYNSLTEELVDFSAVPSQQVQTTMVNIPDNGTPVRDHLVWSLFSMSYMNPFCLGFLAVVFSIKSRDRKLVGDHSGAITYSYTARDLNIAATALSIFSFIVFVILFVINFHVSK